MVTIQLRMINGDRVELRIPKKMNNKITRIADLTESTRSEVIRSALRDYLDKRLLELGDK